MPTRGLVRALIAVALFVPVAATATAFGAGAPSAVTPPAVSNLENCVSQRHALDVVFLIDESGSLGGQGRPGTDPTAQRVTGIRAALAGLSRLAAGSGSQPTAVHALLMGFYSKVETAPAFKPGTVGTFQSVTPGSEPDLLHEAESFASRDTGNATDYLIALRAAREALAERAATSASADGESACQAVVFFTDGGYDPLTNRTAGLQSLCRRGGVADSLRADGVTLFTVFLSTSSSPGDLSFLQAITDGSGSSRCGTTANSSNGLVISVKDAGTLAFFFANLFGGAASPISTVPGHFVVPPGINRFVLDVQSPGGSVKLAAPDGSSTRFRTATSSTATLAGTDLVATSLSPQFVEIVGSVGTATPFGTWRIKAGGTTPLYTVQLFSDVAPVATSTLPAVDPGTQTTFDLSLETPDGRSLPPGVLADGAQISAGLFDAGGADSAPVAITREGTSYQVSFNVPATSQAASYELDAAATLPSVDGVPVTAGRATFTLKRAFPPGTPQPLDTYLSFPTLRGSDPSTALLHLQGTAGGSGCAWIGSVDPVAPGQAHGVGVAPVQHGSRATCAPTAPGQTSTLRVTIHADHPAIGSLGGTATLHLSGPDGGDHVVTIPIRGRLDVKHDIPVEAAIVALLVVAGLLLSLLVVHILNVWTALFIAPQRVRYRCVEVEVQPGGWVRSRGSQALGLDVDPADFELLQRGGRARGARRLTVGGVALATVASGSLRDRTFGPLRGPYGTAYAHNLIAGTDTKVHPRAGRGDRVEVPLDLHRTWLFVPSGVTDAGLVVGTLTLIIIDVEPLTQRVALVHAVEGLLPGEVHADVIGSAAATNPQMTAQTPPPQQSAIEIDDPL